MTPHHQHVWSLYCRGCGLLQQLIKYRPYNLFITFIAAALLAGGTRYAVGAPDHVGEALQALEQVQSLGLAPRMNSGSGMLRKTADGGLALVAGDASMRTLSSADAPVPQSSADALVRIPKSAVEFLDSDRVRVARIRVPGAAGPAPLRVNTNTVLYSNTAPAVSTALTISVFEEDSLVEHFTILHDRTAPREHRTEIALEPGETLITTSPKEAAIIDASGNVTGTVEAPWASDFLGNDVPFEMTVEGNAVIVSVAHPEANYAYPIVVDPLFRRKCGWTGCRYYLSRRFTHEIAGPVSAGVATGGCLAVLKIPEVGGFLSAACAVEAVVFRTKAGECEKKNQCLTVNPLIGIWSLSCKGGRYCPD